MAQGKLSPRQKMINMMYLVLTALLALNVTKEVINAFVTINQSVELSKQNLEKKNSTTYQAFARNMSVDAAKYGEVNNRANQIKAGAQSLVNFIDSTKQLLISAADKIDKGEVVPTVPAMENKEDYDTPTHLMIGDDDAKGKGAIAENLKTRLDNFKKLIIANAPKSLQSDYQKRMDILLNTNDPASTEDSYKEGKRTWELMSFYHNPVVASIALLTKIQSDVRTAESQVTDDLLASVDINIVKFNQFDAKVIPNSTVVTIGSEYKADVFVSATSTTMVPEVFIGATTDSTGSPNCNGCVGNALPNENGMGKFIDRPSSEGEKKWSGVIRIKQPDGSYLHYPFNQSYTAQKPNSVVAAEKMNVLYIGVDNPMAISVPGVPNTQVRPSISGSGGTLSPNSAAGGGHYIAKVTTVGKAVISVSATVGDKNMSMGTFEYRVKRVPDPIATIANSKGGPINKNVLAAGTLIPLLENFDFQLFFKITKFRLTVIPKGKDLLEYEGSGNQLTGQMREAIQKLRAGDKVFFEYIKAIMDKSPDRTERSLSPMAFTVQ
jgi:gliding motility-associated protein GldM